ncbi:diguanylate cyclase [Trichocoleus sp. FACHB-90]|uniref:diguanylate cyclase domain-containing protein n=1 Tax=Cyanophyceae TaxID=3028117 RepID=UPI0016838BB1|nr:diguanylate cyclase [Trichocoleus sp. FACHB-90]MBD1927197.1 diguanylate cyclase [Trichocoleus sp. FACHB-90]
MKDITSAHKAEEHYALAVTAGQVGLWNWNLQTCEMYFNPSWKAMLGYTDREIPNHQAAWLRLIYPDDREWVMTSANIHIEGLTPQFEIEHRMLHKNGSVRWFLCRGMAFRDETGKPYRMAGSTTDITERKRTEEALQESEYRYYTLAKMSPVGIFHTDAEGNCLYVNERWRELTGLTLAEALGQGWVKAIHPDDRSRMLVEWHQAIVGNCTFAYEYRFRRSDGVVTWVFGQAVPEKGQGNSIVGFIGTITDITERKATEEALRLQCFRERLIGSMLERIRQSLDLGEILNTTVAEVRQFLECDRVLVHRFQPDWTGVITVESQDPRWTPILGTCIADRCFSENYVHLYQHGRVQAVTDIYTSGLSQCHINLLERFQVRANLVVPILQERVQTLGDSSCSESSHSKLWGLLIAHQCRDSRQWQPWEMDLLKSLSAQVGMAIQQAELYQQLQAANLQLQRLATLDGLTQVANRRRFDEYLDQEWRRLKRDRFPLSLIMCDIDCFKAFNDTYGHQAGDACLIAVANAIATALKRPADLVARYGGEEFAAILPNTTGSGAFKVAQTIRAAVQALKIVHATSLVSEYVTLSLGVACTVPDRDTLPETLLKAADEALYQAKASGRDASVYAR